jgi:hypothetical protein
MFATILFQWVLIVFKIYQIIAVFLFGPTYLKLKPHFDYIYLKSEPLRKKTYLAFKIFLGCITILFQWVLTVFKVYQIIAVFLFGPTYLKLKPHFDYIYLKLKPHFDYIYLKLKRPLKIIGITTLVLLILLIILHLNCLWGVIKILKEYFRN